MKAIGPAAFILFVLLSPPPLWPSRFGSAALKTEFLLPSIMGDKVACLGVSEVGAGSDVASRFLPNDTKVIVKGNCFPPSPLSPGAVSLRQNFNLESENMLQHKLQSTSDCKIKELKRFGAMV